VKARTLLFKTFGVVKFMFLKEVSHQSCNYLIWSKIK